MLFKFDSLAPLARRCLEQAGWSENRSVNVDEFIQENQAAGLIVSEAAVQFYRSFGDLTVFHPGYNSDDPNDRSDWCEFHSSWAYSSRFIASRYTPYIGTDIAALGVEASEHIRLFIASTGEIYGGFEDNLYRFGRDVVTALNCICTASQAEHIEMLK